jgi:glycosyltransferase involved in cell wall biosynthesis
MKIAHIVDSMEVGGAETLVAQMCRLQREVGHEPRVYAIAALGPLGEQLRREGFVVEANVARHLPDALRNFYRIFRASRPDAVHLHNPTPTIYAAMAARIAGVPRIVSTRHSLVGPPHRRVQELKYALAALFCDSVVGICDATVENLRSLHTVPRGKLVRIYNGAAPLERVSPERCPPKSGFTLVYVGRLVPVKNHGLLLHAFRIALASMPELRLWMVGDGTERAATERLAADLGIAPHFTFWGQQLDVAPFFSAADAFIMSSRSEGLPMSLLQAFSLGLPAIVTDVGGMAEVVRLCEGGIVVPADDPEAMAGAILGLATNQQERDACAASAAGAFASRFTLQAMTHAYLRLYRGNTQQ